MARLCATLAWRSGFASIDEHTLTGEGKPAEKGVGEPVFASTVVLEGKLGIKVEKAGSETVAVQIGEILKRTADYKLSIQSRGEALADKEVVPRLCIGLLSVPILGPSIALTAMMRASRSSVRTASVSM